VVNFFTFIGKPTDRVTSLDIETSYAFAKNLKNCATEAGISDFHLHQLRHTFAWQVCDKTGSISDVQEALGHQDQATTRIYLERVDLKRD
jgi:site-specific recombinase XerD